MAAQFIADMTGPWKSGDYSEKFSDAILALVSKKVDADETTTVATLEEAPSQAGESNVVDLTDLLAERKPGAAPRKTPAICWHPRRSQRQGGSTRW